MSISFNSIPINIRTVGSYVEFDNSRAVQGTPARPYKALVIGQVKTSGSGTVAVEVPTLIPSGAAAEAYFGVGSQIAEMCKAFKLANKYTELWAVALEDDAAGVAATGTITIAGTASADGTIYGLIGGKAVNTSVTSGDAASAIATAMTAAIQADTTLPISAAVNGVTPEQIDITCKWEGPSGNNIDVRVNYQQGEALPTGVTSVTIVEPASGANAPDYTDALTAIGDEQYNIIALGTSDTTELSVLDTELALRWGPMVQAEGQAYSTVIGTQGAMTTLGNAENSAHIVLFGAGKSPSSPWNLAASVAGLDGAQCEIDVARPRQTLEIVGMLPPLPAEIMTREERNILLTDGIATFYVDSSGTCRIERLITTYQTNALSVPDTSYLDVVTMHTLSFIRYSLNARIQLRFPRHKLAADGTNFDPGQAIVTPSAIKNEILALFAMWEKDGLVENYDQFKDDLTVEINGSDPNRVDAILSPDLINQFRVFAGQIQFIV